jgi:general secretion pathway protein I
MRGHGYRNRGGFTLIEVMVALLLVTLALAAAVELGTGSARQLEAMSEATRAHWVAMNRLTQLRATDRFPAKGEKSGRVHEQGRTWYWKQVVRDGPGSGLRVADIRVGTSAGDPHAARIRGVFGRELASPPAQNR